MNTKAPMNRRAINTKEDSIRHWGPSRVPRITIKTHLKTKPNQNYLQSKKSQQKIQIKITLQLVEVRSEPDPNPKKSNKATKAAIKRNTNLILGFSFELPENGIFVSVTFKSHWRRKIKNSFPRGGERKRRERGNRRLLLLRGIWEEKGERKFEFWKGLFWWCLTKKGKKSMFLRFKGS